MNRKEAYEFCYEKGARLMEIYNKDQLDLLITYLGKFISDRSRYVPSKHSKLTLEASDGIVHCFRQGGHRRRSLQLFPGGNRQ